jgi:hypothetical protein
VQKPSPHPATPLPAFQLGGRADITDPIPGIDDTARFHEGWEARIFGIFRTVSTNGLFTTDEFRHAIERLPHDSYKNMLYFERWIHVIQQLCLANGHIDHADLASGYRKAAAHAHAHPSPMLTDIAPHDSGNLPPPPTQQRFDVGARVYMHDGPGDHHRMPAWAHGLMGIIRDVRGHFPLPDLIVDRRGTTNATDRYTLYSITVRATDAFADAHPHDLLALDIYDPYLEGAE